ncbi:DUF423 domain-containing protein [bacterium]|nr:DUF423 domain-containing protein [bacterium]
MFWLRWGIIQCFLSVALGAFAAHALKDNITEYYLKVFETSVRYQFFHGLALILVILVMQAYKLQLNIVAKGFAFGSIIFCGSLYALVLTQYKFFGAVTPIGGSLWLFAWAVMFFKTFTVRAKNN